MAVDLCWGCKGYREVAWTEEETSRTFCASCLEATPLSSEEIAWNFVLLTIPFKPGDKVEARTAAELYDGIGHVEEISMSLEHGGTPVYPTFRVVIDEKAYPSCPDEMWYTEVCLTHLTDTAEQAK